jgi:AraC-like DNA-binding protein
VIARHRYLEHPAIADAHAPVEAFWETSILEEGTYLVLPDGRMDLVVRCEEAETPNVRVAAIAIIGPSSRPARIPVAKGQRFIGARLRPGFGGCLGVAPTSVVDEAIRDDAARHSLGTNGTKLIEARGLPEISKALRDVVNQCASRAQDPEPSTLAAIGLLHASAGCATVVELSSATGVPDRTLRRRIHQAVGLSPKRFAGVLRFQHAMRRLQQPQAPSLAEVATDCGYSDQAHLTREFQRFGGFTPGHRLPATLVTFPLGQLAD